MSKSEIKGSGSTLLENTGSIVLVLGLIAGGVMILSGVTNFESGYSLLGSGIGIIFVAVVVFALSKTLSSINNNLEALKQYKRHEYRESQKTDEDKPFDPFED
jgi:TctA family transporter